MNEGKMKIRVSPGIVGKTEAFPAMNKMSGKTTLNELENKDLWLG